MKILNNYISSVFWLLLIFSVKAEAIIYQECTDKLRPELNFKMCYDPIESKSLLTSYGLLASKNFSISGATISFAFFKEGDFEWKYKDNVVTTLYPDRSNPVTCEIVKDQGTCENFIGTRYIDKVAARNGLTRLINPSFLPIIYQECTDKLHPALNFKMCYDPIESKLLLTSYGTLFNKNFSISGATISSAFFKDDNDYFEWDYRGGIVTTKNPPSRHKVTCKNFTDLRTCENFIGTSYDDQKVAREGLLNLVNPSFVHSLTVGRCIIDKLSTPINWCYVGTNPKRLYTSFGVFKKNYSNNLNVSDNARHNAEYDTYKENEDFVISPDGNIFLLSRTMLSGSFKSAPTDQQEFKIGKEEGDSWTLVASYSDERNHGNFRQTGKCFIVEHPLKKNLDGCEKYIENTLSEDSLYKLLKN